MFRHELRNTVVFTALILFGSFDAAAQTIQDQTVQTASVILNEALSSPLYRIPAAMLEDCHGVAIVPNVIKGGFIVGARHGRGLLVVRDPDGSWHAPVFITLTGGNIGWQVGVQSSDIVLVFKTAQSVQGILSGKLTIGGDAAAAAGPVGREAAAATDGNLKAEIYTYSRTRGLFAGISIDGSVIQIDQLSTGEYYRSPQPGQPVVIPPAALQLTQTIASHAENVLTVQPNRDLDDPTSRSDPNRQPTLAQQVGSSEADVIRNQLLQIAPELFDILDPQWRAFLALPFHAQDGGHPSAVFVGETLNRYNLVATDLRFQQLAGRPEFRSVHGLLQHYQLALAPNSTTLQLPPPPDFSNTPAASSLR